MTDVEIRQYIIDFIDRQSFVPAMHLVTEICRMLYSDSDVIQNETDVLELINGLVRDKQIRELEFTRQDSPYRLRSLYYSAQITFNWPTIITPPLLFDEQAELRETFEDRSSEFSIQATGHSV